MTLTGTVKLKYHKSNYMITIPHSVGSDSMFPFEKDERVNIRIEDGSRVILFKKIE